MAFRRAVVAFAPIISTVCAAEYGWTVCGAESFYGGIPPSYRFADEFIPKMVAARWCRAADFFDIQLASCAFLAAFGLVFHLENRNFACGSKKKSGACGANFCPNP